MNPLRKLLEARQRVEAARQALVAAQAAADIAVAEMASAALLERADTVRPPAGVSTDWQGGLL